VVQFFQIFIESFVIFVINSTIGALLFAAFRGYIRDRIEEWLFDSLSRYVRDQLSITLQNPSETARALKPLITSIIQEVMKDFQGSQKEGTFNSSF